MAFQGTCPTCGAPVEFNAANSLVVICDSCNSVVGRGDGKLEEYGKVADLTQTDSPLQVGLNGDYKGVPYEVTGRTQYRHAAGGVWDEWYVALRDGDKWGWLAEAQGRYYMTFQKALPSGHQIPPVHDLQIEDEIMVPSLGRMKVVEVGEATLIGGEGEVPFKFRPGEKAYYADLQGPGGKFASLDGSTDPPKLFVGGQFDLEKLGIATAESREDDERRVESLGVTCPNCGGAMELSAPDDSERVACPYCDSLLECDHGNLKFLHVLSQQRVNPTLPLGGKGVLRGREYTIIGFMQRKVRYQGREYPWNEYLLYTPRQPFHWLIESEHHWSLGKPVSAGEVRAHVRTARWEGKNFRTFDRSVPFVSTVYGEFYWKVEVGERVGATDYIHPPYTISREETMPQPEEGALPDTTTAREVNYTVSKYVPVEEVEEGFGVKPLMRPTSIAPNQPYPHKGIYYQAMLMCGAALLAGALIFISSWPKKVFEQTYQGADVAARQFVSQPFKVRGRRALRITAKTPQRYQWAFAEGGLFNEKTKKLTDFSIAVPAKRAGSTKSQVKYLSSIPAGDYTLQLRFRFQPNTTNRSITIRIDQGGSRLRYWVYLLLLLLIVPIGVGIHHFSFEAQRWAESDFSPFSSE